MNDPMKSVLQRKLIGFRSGDKKQPVYAAMPGSLVTQAFIHCSQCRSMVSGNMGPHRDTWCITCTDKNVEVVAKEKVASRNKAETEARKQK